MKPLSTALSILFYASCAWAAPSIAETLSSRLDAVPIVVSEPANRSEDASFSPAELKKALETALAARRSPRFSVTADKSAAELELSTEVTESIFLEHDPVDKLIGLGGTAWDAANVEHYARLTAVYAVKDAKSGRTLWTDKLKAAVTDKTMSREESRSKVAARAAEILIREAFGKKNRGR